MTEREFLRRHDERELLRRMRDHCAARYEMEYPCDGCALSAMCRQPLGCLDDERIERITRALQPETDGGAAAYLDEFLAAFPDAEREEDGTPVACRNLVFGEACGRCPLDGVDTAAEDADVGAVCAAC